MEKKSIEELLKPRYKVVALWPNTEFKVGQIVTDTYGLALKFYDNYPHLFKKLEWWEDRKPEEMPEYVKRNEDNMSSLSGDPLVLIVKKHFHYGEDWRSGNIDFFTAQNGLANGYSYSGFQPATEQEYNDYINQKK